MDLKYFYELSDKLKYEFNTRGILSGTEYEKFISSAAKVASHLTDQSGKTVYSESGFWKAVENMVKAWNKDPLNDMPARETALTAILFPLSAPEGLIEKLISETAYVIPLSNVSDSCVTSIYQSISGSPSHLVISVTAVDITGSAEIQFLSSADNLHFAVKKVGSVSEPGTSHYVIDAISIPRYYKVLVSVEGSAVVSVIVTPKYYTILSNLN